MLAEVKKQEGITEHRSKNNHPKTGDEATKTLKISPSNLHNRMRGTQSRAQSQVNHQHVSEAEESVLVQWITCITKTGCHWRATFSTNQ